MSEDINGKLKQLIDLLGQENMRENVISVLNALTNSGEKKEAPKPENKIQSSGNTGLSPDLAENQEMMRFLKKAMDHMRNNNDPRINLLHSIKPFLGSRRQNKINNCIMLLQLSSLTRLLEENDNKGESINNEL